MMSVDRERRTWRRGVGLSLEAIMSFGRLATSFANDVRALIYTGGPFQSIYLCVLYLFLLFHLPVLSNQSALSFHLCSDIDPS